MKAVKVETDGSIKLPEEMLRLFPTSTELAVCNGHERRFGRAQDLDSAIYQRQKPFQRFHRGPRFQSFHCFAGSGRKQSQFSVWRFNKIKSELGSGGDASRSSGGGRDLYATGTRLSLRE
jgi:hypothetical protein